VRIKRFQAEGIHGYLRFNCTFHDDLTFLTGINGSGKTTVVRCIAALLCPSLLTLTQTTHDSMMLEVQVGQGTLLISSRRANDRLLLSVSTCQDPFEIPLQLFSDYAEDTTSERYDELLRHYRQLETSVSHPVLDRIRQLPTPMLLGLERRSDLFAGPGRPSRRRPDPSTFYLGTRFQQVFRRLHILLIGIIVKCRGNKMKSRTS
jgi:predicted ATP-binding protein involved in virulence